MKCPCCGAAELVADTRNVSIVVDGAPVVIPDMTGDYCPACGEVILNRAQGDRYSALLGQSADFFAKRGVLGSKQQADKAWAKVSGCASVAGDEV